MENITRIDKTMLPKKRVLHGVYSFDFGGAEKVVSYYARYHDRNRFEPIVCSLTGEGVLEDEIKKFNVKTYVFNKKKISSFLFLWKLVKFIKDQKIDIIHSHNFVVNNWLIIAGYLAGVNTIIMTNHTDQSHFYKKGFLFSVISKVLGLFNKRIITVCDKVKILNQKRSILNKGRYITIYNGIDPDLYSKEIDRKKFYKEFLIEEGTKIVGNVGSLTPQKGQRYFLEAAKIILEQYSDVVFLIIGKGPLKNELETFAEELKIKKNVTFIGFRTDIPELLQFMNIFVISSLREGFPISLLEAMASARACVVTDVGGNSESIRDGENGYIVSPKNPNQLADRILRLLKEDDLRQRFGERARKRVFENYTADRMIRESEKIYELLI